MPASPAGVQQFPIVCVSCKAIAGLPHYAKTLPNGATEVGLRCHDCQHEWTIEVEPLLRLAPPNQAEREGNPL